MWMKSASMPSFAEQAFVERRFRVNAGQHQHRRVSGITISSHAQATR